MRFRWEARDLVGLALAALLFLSGCERVLGLDGLTDLPADAALGADAVVGVTEASGGGGSDATTGNLQDAGRDVRPRGARGDVAEPAHGVEPVQLGDGEQLDAGLLVVGEPGGGRG